MLSSVNLPGGQQRIRTYEDQLQMRSFFQEHDLISVSACVSFVGAGQRYRQFYLFVGGFSQSVGGLTHFFSYIIPLVFFYFFILYSSVCPTTTVAVLVLVVEQC